MSKVAIKQYGQDAATMIALAVRKVEPSDITAKPLCIYYDHQRLYAVGVDDDELTTAILRDLNILSFKQIDDAHTYLNRYSWWTRHAKRLADACKTTFKIKPDALSAEELVYSFYTSKQDGSLGDFTLSAPAQISIPSFMYLPEISLVRKAVYRDMKNLSLPYLEFAYANTCSSEAEKKEFRVKIDELGIYTSKKSVPLYDTNILNAVMQGYNADLPIWMIDCTAQNHQATQSEKHFCANVASVMKYIFKDQNIKRKSNAIPLFKRALAKEREELAKGNHVFYHGRQWEWDYVADVYKGLHNATHPTDKTVGNDYTFLRFDASSGDFGNALFLNVPLFGNTKHWGNSTAQLVLSSYDWSGGKHLYFAPDKLFSQFKLAAQYPAYKDNFKQLKLLHQKANPSKIGSLLMVVLDDKKVNTVYLPVRGVANNKNPVTLSTGEQTLETRKIIAELKAGKLPDGGDSLEYVLPLDKDYALDPQKGPRIYSMNACDPAKYKEYTDYRDALFSKIKKDMEKSKTA